MDIKGTLVSLFNNGMMMEHTKNGTEEQAIFETKEDNPITSIVPYYA